MRLPGRVWTMQKIISFWKYPDNIREFVELMKDLDYEGIEIDDDWIVDFSKKTPVIGKSVGEYSGSKKPLPKVTQDLQTTHLMNPAMKELIKQAKIAKGQSIYTGFGSDKQAELARRAGFKTYFEYKNFIKPYEESITLKFKDVL